MDVSLRPFHKMGLIKIIGLAMKINFLLPLGISLCLTASATAGIRDDFNGDSINTNLWAVSLPFSSSKAYETNGHAVLESRGTLTTVAEFEPEIEIKGRFKFANSASDHFRIVFRSNFSDI